MRAPIKCLVLVPAIVLACASFDDTALHADANVDRIGRGEARIVFGAPVLAPFAHTRFCLAYPAECKVRAVIFRGGALPLTPKRRNDLVRINAEVNHTIRPQRTNESIADEKWLIAPASGDCNDYAVTKRHQLLARGWPARALLLAEVVIPSGEHHLVLVVRMREGDLVADNLDLTIRPWTATRYRWVRIQSPANPMLWRTIT
ncbi:MAG TPA: transglutaminase-like cysteine peptidase [Pseudolabrys sp.]|jgi:predicted transglutaminase-like cysteine proteinase|nr:transglutaminase-like cysteine peptidase [Pseudolabrys sp.]